MESFFNGLQRFGISRLTAILGGAAGIAAVIAAIVLNVAAQPQGLLYANLDLKEASEITASLDQAGIKYDVKGGGSTIMVNRDAVDKARVLLASKGLPTAGSVGYEIFDNAPALGQTEFVQNLDQQRALEGELARTLRSMRGISSARVHLVMPKRELFEDTAQQPTASVVVGLAGGAPGAESVRAIRNLIAGAVPNLKPDNVTVIDDRNHLLAAGGQNDSALDGAGGAHKTEVEENIRKRITDIVEGVVGPGAARVMVTADLDPTSTTQERLTYDPDGTGPITRSTQTSDSTDTNSDGGNGGAVTAANNIAGGAATGAAGSTTTSQSGTTTELTNNEISTLKTTTVTMPGEIRKIGVSVAIDDLEVPAKDGKAAPTYTKRSEADIQKIHDLVAAAVAAYVPAPAPGQPVEDPVKVINISFNHDLGSTAGTGGEKSMFDFDKNDIMRAAEMGVLLVVALLTIFLVARPLLKFINGGTAGAGGMTGPGGMQLAGASGGGGMLSAASTGPQIGYTAADNIAATGLVPSVEQEQRLDIAKIEGQVKASSIKKVSEFVDRHPEESVSILRSWLHDS